MRNPRLIRAALLILLCGTACCGETLAAPLLSTTRVSVAPREASRGRSVRIDFRVASGAVALKALTAHICVASFGGETVYATTPVGLGDLPAGQSAPVSLDYVVPASLKDGLYGVSLKFTTSTPGATLAPLPEAGWFRLGGAISPIATAPPARLTFAEEFTGPVINRRLWRTSLPFPANSNSFEAQVYLPDAVTTGQGLGRIVATRDTRRVVSGLLSSFGAFAQRYGHFEMKAKLPAGNGVWPAFWLLPEDQSWPPELDVMEFLGRTPNTIYSTNHWRDASGVNRQAGVSVNGPNYSLDRHVYALDWRPGLLRFSVDGVETGRLTANVPARPMYIVANLAVASGGWPGPYDATTPFPATMEIDYIRSYQFDDLADPTPANLRFRKTIVSNLRPRVGETVRIEGGLETGALDLSDLKLHVFLRSFDGNTQHSYAQIAFGNAPRGSLVPFTLNFTTPATLPPGVYNIAYAATTANGGNIYDNVAERLTIRAP